MQLLSDESQLRAARDSWTALFEAARCDNPFLYWEWVWHWWHDFRRVEPGSRWRLHVLVFEDGDGIARGAAPFFLYERRLGPAVWRTLRMMGSGGGLTELRGFLIWPGWEEQVAIAFVAALVEQRMAYDRCVVDGLVPGTPLHAWFAARATRAGWTWGAALTDHVVALAPSWEEFRGGLRRNIRESLRHCYNSLLRAGHVWRFDWVADGPDLHTALDSFLTLHAARARMNRGPTHVDVFATPRHRAFLHATADALAPRRGVVVGRLWVDDRLVAARLGLASADSLYLYFSGYDPAFGRYGVATTVTAELIKMAIGEGLRTVNFSVGTDVSKTRWGTAEIRLHRLHIPSPVARAQLLHAADERARRAGRRLLKLLLSRAPAPRRALDDEVGPLAGIV